MLDMLVISSVITIRLCPFCRQKKKKEKELKDKGKEEKVGEVQKVTGS